MFFRQKKFAGHAAGTAPTVSPELAGYGGFHRRGSHNFGGPIQLSPDCDRSYRAVHLPVPDLVPVHLDLPAIAGDLHGGGSGIDPTDHR